MIHINHFNATNVPILTKKLRKTKIYCISSSSRLYFYKSSKSKEKTVNPNWDFELDIDLFRCHTLSFLLNSSKFASKKVYIGKVEIDVTSFLTQGDGKKLIDNPTQSINFDFQIKTIIPTESFLKFSISYFPVIYPSITLKDIQCTFIHIWTSYSPSNPTNYDTQNNLVEISMIQGYKYKNGKNIQGAYKLYNKNTIWESVGCSSQNQYFYGQTGLSQISSLCCHRIKNKYEVFILNSANYQGTVTLNLVVENEKKVKIIQNQQYIVPKTKHKIIGTVVTYEIQCKLNHKYCFPFCLNVEQNGNTNFFSFPCLSMEIDSSSSTKYDNYFNNSVIQHIKRNFSNFENVPFAKIYQINNEKISLLKHFTDNNLPVNFNLNIFIGGATIFESNPLDDIYPDDVTIWEPKIIIFDKNTHERCRKVEKSYSFHFNKRQIFDFEYYSNVKMNLNQFDINQIIIFILYCDIEMEYTDIDGGFLISQDNNEYHTLLFKNMIYPDKNHTHYIVCFRFEYVEDSWTIFPMRSYYSKKRKLLKALDYQISNNWIIPDEFILQQNESNNYDVSEKELSIGSDS